MSETNSTAAKRKPWQSSKTSPYSFALTCALTWLKLSGIHMKGEQVSAVKVARLLGLTPDAKGRGYAKKAIVEWHARAITTNKSPPEQTEDDFYNSQSWRKLRYQALRNSNGRCSLCGSPPGAHSLHVDHIKPRSLFPDLALELSNLQILCRDCNLGKSNTDCVDWRSARSDESFQADHDREVGRMLDQLR